MYVEMYKKSFWLDFWVWYVEMICWDIDWFWFVWWYWNCVVGVDLIVCCRFIVVFFFCLSSCFDVYELCGLWCMVGDMGLFR